MIHGTLFCVPTYWSVFYFNSQVSYYCKIFAYLDNSTLLCTSFENIFFKCEFSFLFFSTSYIVFYRSEGCNFNKNQPNILYMDCKLVLQPNLSFPSLPSSKFFPSLFPSPPSTPSLLFLFSYRLASYGYQSTMVNLVAVSLGASFYQHWMRPSCRRNGSQKLATESETTPTLTVRSLTGRKRPAIEPNMNGKNVNEMIPKDTLLYS